MESPRIDAGSVTTTTPFGSITVTPDGWKHLDANRGETRAWANRPGAVWPCSYLTDSPITATFDPGGNLVDYTGAEDAPAHELSAWADDVAELAGVPIYPA